MSGICSRVAMVAILGFGTLVVHASPLRFRIDNLTAGTAVVITDNGVEDSNSTVGSIVFVKPLGSELLSHFLEAFSNPPFPSLNENDSLHLNFDIHNTTPEARSVRITVVKDDYSSLESARTLTFASSFLACAPGCTTTMTVQIYENGANLVPDLGADQPFGPIGAIGAVPPGSIGTYPGAGVAFGPGVSEVVFAEHPIIDSAAGLYARFIQVTIEFSTFTFANGSAVAFAAPEPTTLGLLCIALAGLGLARRRKLH